MGWLDKAKDIVKDPKNQERVKAAIQNQTAKRKHTHPHDSTRRHGAGIFDDHEEEFDEGDE